MWFAMHFTDCLYHVSFRRYRPLKLPLSCEVVQKGGFGAPICRGGNTPDFGHAFSNYTHFRACGRLWLSSVQRARRLEGEKRRKKEEESVVKHQSADMYVGRASNCQLGLLLGPVVPIPMSSGHRTMSVLNCILCSVR